MMVIVLSIDSLLELMLRKLSFKLTNFVNKITLIHVARVIYLVSYMYIQGLM